MTVVDFVGSCTLLRPSGVVIPVDLMMMKKLVVCSQLYGEADPDQDVSPDTEDPEAAGETLETVSHCWFSQMKTLFQVIFNLT